MKEVEMSLRDYFAGQAMQSLVCSRGLGEDDWDIWAESAYEVADAMLKAREK